ncbi:MAG: hypothetical protein MK439_11340, partial [SAR324 cluster bacterium]|nr:hypothetical protein [SAR324 cluster bacterium]
MRDHKPQRWLKVVGIGEDGLEGISTALSGLGTAVGEGFDNLDELDRIIGEIERRLRETGIFD